MTRISIASRRKGRKLAREREFLGFSQEGFAVHVGLSAKTIWCAEQGAPCRLSTKRRILKALRIDWSDGTEFFASKPRRRI